MGSLASIVNVQISRQTSVPTRAGFGTGAFLSDVGFESSTKSYTSLAEMTGDSEISANAAALAAGAAYFGQQLSAPKFTLLKLESGVDQVSVLTVSTELITGNSTVVTLNGTPLTPEVFATSHAATMAAIAVVIAADAAIDTAVAVGNAITITAAVADTVFSVSAETTLGATQPTWVSQITSNSGGIFGSLTKASSFDNDWYGLAISSRTLADIEEASDWVQGQGTANPKLFFAQDSDSNLLDEASSADIASILTAKSAFRTAVMYHADDTEYADVAWMGGQLPNDPGSITWAYKQLSLVTVDTFAAGEKSAAHAKNCNTYDVVASVNITEEGKTCDGGSGEFIDTIRGVDWIQVNAQADLYTILVQSPKVPYTTTGLAMFKITLSATLRRAQLMGILTLDEDPVVTVPLIGDIPVVDKATRTLNNLNFTAILAGAIQKVNVQGVVSL